MSLQGKVAVVTGAGTGIGAAVATELAARGARVLLVSRTTERISEIAAAIEAAGFCCETVRGDVRSEDLRSELGKHVERVDILVNNAAVFATYGPLEEVPPEEVELVMEVDLTAALRLTRFVLPGMKRAGWGRIVNVGSVAGSVGAVGQVAYSAAKAGLEGFTRSLAAETAGCGITCNLVQPGLVETSRTTEKIPHETRAHLVRATALGRAGQPREVAHAIAFLASEEASAVTGATLAVDGGLGLR